MYTNSYHSHIVLIRPRNNSRGRCAVRRTARTITTSDVLLKISNRSLITTTFRPLTYVLVLLFIVYYARRQPNIIWRKLHIKVKLHKRTHTRTQKHNETLKHNKNITKTHILGLETALTHTHTHVKPTLQLNRIQKHVPSRMFDFRCWCRLSTTHAM